MVKIIFDGSKGFRQDPSWIEQTSSIHPDFTVVEDLEEADKMFLFWDDKADADAARKERIKGDCDKAGVDIIYLPVGLKD